MAGIVEHLTSQGLAQLCVADGEFGLLARGWNGGLRLEIGDRVVAISLTEGKVSAGGAERGAPGIITLTADLDSWRKLTEAKPDRFHTDIQGLLGLGKMSLGADDVLFGQYYPASMRAIELLRPDGWAPQVTPKPARAGTFDSPVGRYVHVDVGGQDYRVYVEEAGSGIPLLLQHTAGAHGSQYRHLFECREITDHFRLIAYDLPFHGKSMPPMGPRWWAEKYELKGDFLRAFVVSLADALQLHRPAFMGCSVGGMLALDLAAHHPEVFSAVISLEGALQVGGDRESMGTTWHPQVSNESKARAMNSAMSPTSPEGYRRETMQVYAAGWPPAFFGDLYYYMVDYDIRHLASHIDTSQVAVHILNGEYDPSGTLEAGQEARGAIRGAQWTGMMEVGHFPMSENPDAFIQYLLPTLEKVREDVKTRR